MSDTQFLQIALAALPTMLIVLVGILINNSRLGDMNSRLSDMNSRLNDMGTRIDELRAHMDSRFMTSIAASMTSIAASTKCATFGAPNSIASKKCWTPGSSTSRSEADYPSLTGRTRACYHSDECSSA